MLALDGRVGRAAADGEVVPADDDWPAVHARAAEDEVGRREELEVVVGVVRRLARDLAHLVEGVRVDQACDALADGQPPLVVLALHPLRAAEPVGESLAPTQLD